MKTSLIVLIGVLVLALLSGGAFWYIQARDNPAAPGQARFPQAAVRGYLTALAAGKAADALSFVANAPEDAEFLTDTVLAASNATHPITIVAVTKSNASTTQNAVIDVVLNVGKARFEFPYHVEKVGSFYFIEDALPMIEAKGLSVPGVGVTLNGVAFTATDGEVPLFPGVYTIGVDNSMLQITRDSQFVVSSTGKPYQPKLALALADGAHSKMLDFAIEKMKSCMAERTTETTCGFIANGLAYVFPNEIVTPKTKTIRWEYLGIRKSFKNETFTWSQDDPTRATADILIKIKVTFKATNGVWYWMWAEQNYATIDFSNPEDLTMEIGFLD